MQKVWIIDDDPLFIYGVKRLMNRVDFADEIEVFQNGLEAFNQLSLQVKRGTGILPDAILLDINMPVWDGWDFMQAIKSLELENSVKLFVITSSRLSSDTINALKHPVVQGFYRKPITSDNLRQMKSLLVEN